MRTTLTAVLATLLVLAFALAGCSKQEEAQGPTEIVPGLSYVDSVIGQGAEVQPDDFVMVHYTGWLYVDGTKRDQFDSSVERGEPIAFPLGRSFVIQGWDKGLPGMRVGGKRALIIEAEMGYGAPGSSAGDSPQFHFALRRGSRRSAQGGGGSPDRGNRCGR